MTYYIYIGHNPNRPANQRWGIGDPISFVDVVRNRKDGKARIERLCEAYPELLPKEGWGRVTHRELDTDDNQVVEAIKNDIRVRLAAFSTGKTGERRMWARKPNAPAGFYNLEFYEVNKIVTDAIRASGLYRPSAA